MRRGGLGSRAVATPQQRGVRQLVIRPEGLADIDAPAEYYASKENVELGLRFYDAIERPLARLVEQPHLGSVQERLRGRLLGCRRWPVVKPFQVHHVLYLPSDTHVEVLRVLHAARDLPSLSG